MQIEAELDFDSLHLLYLMFSLSPEASCCDISSMSRMQSTGEVVPCWKVHLIREAWGSQLQTEVPEADSSSEDEGDEDSKDSETDLSDSDSDSDSDEPQYATLASPYLPHSPDHSSQGRKHTQVSPMHTHRPVCGDYKVLLRRPGEELRVRVLLSAGLCV